VAFAAAATFLLLNGRKLTAPETEAYDAVITEADGRRTEVDLAGWLRANSEPVR
jgi:prophage maintenance system killer protein